MLRITESYHELASQDHILESDRKTISRSGSLPGSVIPRMPSGATRTKMATLRGVEATQHGRRLLVGTMSAFDLAQLYGSGAIKVDVFSATNDLGYQRTLSKTRSRKFGRFVKDPEKGVSPTAILLYCRNSGEAIQNRNKGEFDIPVSHEAALYIADGQHRTDGLSEAIKEGWISPEADFEVPVVIFFWDSKKSPKDARLEEATQFFYINTQQKRMRTDLANRYIFKKHEEEHGPINDGTTLRRMKKSEYVPYSIHVTARMRDQGPWKGLIEVPNGTGGAPVSEGSFSDSLAPVVEYATTANLNIGEVIQLLENYWGAVFELCKEAVDDAEKHLLLKTPGMFSLHLFLPVLLARKRDLGHVPTKDQFRRVLGDVGDVFTGGFWNSETGEAATFGIGKKSFAEIADHIAGELE